MMKTLDIKWITEEMRNNIGETFGKMQGAHIHMEAGSASFAAFYDDKIVGFISVYPKALIEPLDGSDAYIDIIETHPDYRKLGVAKQLVKAVENWAKENNHFQVRAWSSADKTAALHMWQQLEYALCPAEIAINGGSEQLKGYYVAKRFVG